MRLLLVAHALPPRSTAGVEVFTLRLARAFAALGHEVGLLAAAHDLGAPHASRRRRELGGLRVDEIVSLYPRGDLVGSYDDPQLTAAARGVLEERRPEAVLVQHLLNLSLGVVSEARRCGARVLLTLHDYWLSCPRDGLRQRADLALCAEVDHGVCAECLRDSPYLQPTLQRGAFGLARRARLGPLLHRVHDRFPRATTALLGALRRAAPPAAASLAPELGRRAARVRELVDDVELFLAPTRFARDRAVEAGVPATRVRVLRLGAVERARPRPAGPRRRFAFVGTVAPHKGVHVLVDAFRGLQARDVRLDVHGSLTTHAAYAEGVRRRAASDPRVRFHGPFPEGGQEAVLADADALVLPSLWWENSPLTVLEALAAGKAVVASDTGGLPELIESGRTGLLVPPGDVAALRGAMGALAAGRALAEPLPPLALETPAAMAAKLLALLK